MTLEIPNEPSYWWSAETGFIICEAYAHSEIAIERLGRDFPRANQACIDIIDRLVARLSDAEYRNLQLSV